MLTVLPDSQDEMNEVYGNPDMDGDGIPDAAFRKEKLAIYTLPFPMEKCWERGTYAKRMLAHKLVGPAIQAALEELLGVSDLAYLKENHYDVYGGVYAFRVMAGGSLLSTHSWGVAIDHLPDLGPYLGENRIPNFISAIWRSHGFVELEHDHMHKQACTCYWR